MWQVMKAHKPQHQQLPPQHGPHPDPSQQPLHHPAAAMHLRGPSGLPPMSPKLPANRAAAAAAAAAGLGPRKRPRSSSQSDLPTLIAAPIVAALQ